MSRDKIVLYGSILLIGGTLLTKDIYSGVQKANAVEQARQAEAEAVRQDKELFRDDPAAHYKQFCRGFVENLGRLPSVKRKQRRNVNPEFSSHVLWSLNQDIATIHSSIRTADLALQQMSSQERQRQVELSSLGGDPVLATYTEHLANMQKVGRRLKQHVDDYTARADYEWYEVEDRIDFHNEFRFNAWNTDSLISPHLGTLDIYGTFLTDGVRSVVQHYRFHFAAQNDKWVLKKIEFSYNGNSWSNLNVGAGSFLDQLR